MEKRRKFQGVLNILSFNRHFYIIGLLVLALLIISYIVIGWSDTLFLVIMLAFTYGLLMPLIISAYVYDFSDYYNFDWLKKVLSDKEKPSTIVNIHAGFDETSFLIKQRFPDATLNVFDFYNAETHTEAAIKRARNASIIYPNTQKITTDRIPFPDKSVDIIFLLSAAHEIRAQKEKIVFLEECRRLCKNNGQIIMLEHLRDFPNFLAFTIGFTHFFSKNTWKKAFKIAGFTSFQEEKFTPFMSIFICKR